MIRTYNGGMFKKFLALITFSLFIITISFSLARADGYSANVVRPTTQQAVTVTRAPAPEVPVVVREAPARPVTTHYAGGSIVVITYTVTRVDLPTTTSTTSTNQHYTNLYNDRYQNTGYGGYSYDNNSWPQTRNWSAQYNDPYYYAFRNFEYMHLFPPDYPSYSYPY
ncbi:MAG TPA: hypothetical protein VEA37_09290 [Flavobacterium sp.]|nr:hypothetical protein [Flavobacterium sp.]